MRRKPMLALLLIPLLIAAPGPARQWIGSFGAAPSVDDDDGEQNHMIEAVDERRSPLPRALVRTLIDAALPVARDTDVDGLVDHVLHLASESLRSEEGSVPPELQASLTVWGSGGQVDAIWELVPGPSGSARGGGGRSGSEPRSGASPGGSGEPADIVAVSEPSSFTLLLLGIGLCAGLARRRGQLTDRSGSRRRRWN